MKSKFTASIRHDAHTIELLYKTQYYAYDKLRIIARFIIGFALIAAALFMSLPIWMAYVEFRFSCAGTCGQSDSVEAQ